MRLIDVEPIIRFIEDGLNNSDKKKAFGYDAIEILSEIEYAPTVDAVPVVSGRWNDVDYGLAYQCSVCGHSTEWQLSDYCPNCGAKMDGEREDDK